MPQRTEKTQKDLFSILIPTWNNLDYLKLCVESIRKNSEYKHQLIIHINEGIDGTREWVEEQGLDFTFSGENIGVCKALNKSFTKAKCDYIAFLNDDMYVLPGWDKVLYDEISTFRNKKWFLSGTMIEPEFTGNTCALAPYDFGRTVEDFREAELLGKFDAIPMEDWNGATWPPNVVPREMWELVGGYSEEFSPGMYSDPDFSMKLWNKGVRYLKGLSNSRVYHFQAKSTGKVTKNPGKMQFLKKWGISSSLFSKYYLRRGEKWNGPLEEPRGTGLVLGKLKSKLRLLIK